MLSYFVCNGVSLDPCPDIVSKVIGNVGNYGFYTVDVILDENDKAWIIEIGDGQVSGLKEFELRNLYNLFNEFKVSE